MSDGKTPTVPFWACYTAIAAEVGSAHITPCHTWAWPAQSAPVCLRPSRSVGCLWDLYREHKTLYPPYLQIKARDLAIKLVRRIKHQIAP